ncbi:L-threonylcarbamoyladenylate synthase [Micrococcus endophyticus]|uniref:L-threonylcarbamoyladenylate synthase n=1 Tax=Micrococcus endophyticus TaxID=455343 RepID=UPI0020056518|nr:L-threonylcarbamoyladenylate synthase [Micrococcus endophyticus]MCK6090509.1 threonylcarbamoyl-AMP synthase [Micrococcus endophyticus]
MADVSDFIDVSDPAALEGAVARAREVLGDRGCVVLPTDTVYGIGADAFSPRAVAVLLAAKGRGRTMPPPVLISDRRVLAGLAYDVPDEAEALAERFWPGALTLILKSQPTLTWDLGETRGTVALRVPDDAVARELLYAVGPMAVSSANRTGMPAATTAEEARGMLGESVDLYLDAGPREDRAPSTIVDCTVTPFRVARQGAVPLEALRELVPDLLAEGEEPPVPADRLAAAPVAETPASAPAADEPAADPAAAPTPAPDGDGAADRAGREA